MATASPISGSPTEIRVIYQGQDWFAVDKPTGMSVHNKKGGDVVSAFPEHDKLFLLNRLDEPVSGILLLATSKSVAAAIQRQFAERTVQKQYRAIAHNLAPVQATEGIWTKPLTKKAENRTKPAGWAGKRVPCKTSWQVEHAGGDQIHLLLTPQTGRKHQLRRHAAIAGWPLLGDNRYGPEDSDFAGRIALHACALVLRPPESNQDVTITSPAPWFADSANTSCIGV